MVPSHENQSNLFAPRVFHGPESRGTPDMSILCWRSWRSSWMMDPWAESTLFTAVFILQVLTHVFFFPDVESLNQRSCHEKTWGLQWLQVGDICKRLEYVYTYMGISWFVPKLCIIIDYRIQFGVMPSNKGTLFRKSPTTRKHSGKHPTLKGTHGRNLHWLTIKSWGTPMRFVLLRNPWGMLEWRGDWGDLSTEEWYFHWRCHALKIVRRQWHMNRSIWFVIYRIDSNVFQVFKQ